jgi:hypothetical protein
MEDAIRTTAGYWHSTKGDIAITERGALTRQRFRSSYKTGSEPIASLDLLDKLARIAAVLVILQGKVYIFKKCAPRVQAAQGGRLRRYDIVGHRAMAERKSKRVLIGEGAYYHPKASLGSLKHNYRYLFLSAIENRTPEVLKELRYRVWPAYDSMHWRIDPLIPQEEWLYQIHPNLARSWMLDIHPKDWTPRAKRVLTPIKKQLLAWSKQYQVYCD